jgi:hypothetical protein
MNLFKRIFSKEKEYNWINSFFIKNNILSL